MCTIEYAMITIHTSTWTTTTNKYNVNYTIRMQWNDQNAASIAFLRWTYPPCNLPNQQKCSRVKSVFEIKHTKSNNVQTKNITYTHRERTTNKYMYGCMYVRSLSTQISRFLCGCSVHSTLSCEPIVFAYVQWRILAASTVRVHSFSFGFMSFARYVVFMSLWQTNKQKKNTQRTKEEEKNRRVSYFVVHTLSIVHGKSCFRLL